MRFLSTPNWNAISSKRNVKIMQTNLEYLKRWEEIANATDLIQALTRHFAYLAGPFR
ncbi:hypothetical protein LEP1GSC040_1258 [Leptospira santarosai str. 2000030832]|nr:hypothetical protein LEP1GSC040_1258 [Leptospira santarosai str. 2000030832]